MSLSGTPSRKSSDLWIFSYLYEIFQESLEMATYDIWVYPPLIIHGHHKDTKLSPKTTACLKRSNSKSGQESYVNNWRISSTLTPLNMHQASKNQNFCKKSNNPRLQEMLQYPQKETYFTEQQIRLLGIRIPQTKPLILPSHSQNQRSILRKLYALLSLPAELRLLSDPASEPLA
jgi:hypothetical protein